MKAVFAVIVGAALLIGCGVLDRSTEFVERNPIVADLAMEQGAICRAAHPRASLIWWAWLRRRLIGARCRQATDS